MTRMHDMPRKRQPAIHATLLAVLAYCLSGCGPGRPMTRAMVPELQTAASQQPSKTVRVVQVAGGRESQGIHVFVSNEQFREALVQTLTQSGLLTPADEEPADLELDVVIKQQGVHNANADSRAAIVTRYELRDPRTGAEACVLTYRSEFSSTQHGADRFRKAREGAVRDNLAAFVGGARDRCGDLWAAL